MVTTTWEDVKKSSSVMDEYQETEPGLINFNVILKLDNGVERSQQVIITLDLLLGLEVITILSQFAEKSRISAQQILEHPSFSEHLFGLTEIGGGWFLTTTWPLANANLGDLYSTFDRLAWVADALESIHSGDEDIF